MRHKQPDELRRHRVRRVWADTVSRSSARLRGSFEPLNKSVQSGFGPCPRKGNDFVKVYYIGVERQCACRDIANRGDAGRQALEQAAIRVLFWRVFAATTFRDNEPNPIDKRHSDIAERLLQIAEFKMCV